MTTYISNKPNTYGIPYRRGGKIFRATYCNRCDSVHEKKMIWKPKEATFSNKLKYFSDFLENNKILLEQFQIKYSSVSSINHINDLNTAFTSIKDQLIKSLVEYKKNGYIGEYNQNKYIDHFLTGNKTDLDTAKVYLDFLTILYNIYLLVYHYNPNKEDNCRRDTKHGYAYTCHCAQGASIRVVFVDEKDINSIKNKWLKLKLFYVAFTRASEELFRLV